MTIALPLFGSRISPRFDCAAQVMLARVEDGRVVARESVATEAQHCLTRINWLCQRGVQVVICGGISGFSLRMLKDRGLRVLPGLTGDAEEVLQLFLDGRLRSNQFKSGGRRRRCQQRGGGSGGGHNTG
ncbi:NifB/NifX family molybdenum-iron cluster-binding protein [Candidatus Zixiibacteriota bacterium]